MTAAVTVRSKVSAWQHFRLVSTSFAIGFAKLVINCSSFSPVLLFDVQPMIPMKTPGKIAGVELKAKGRNLFFFG